MGTLKQYVDTIDVGLEELIAPSSTLRPINYELVSELARSIRNAGLLQPIVVRQTRGQYEVIFGRHRLEACRQNGMSTVRVVVSQMSEEVAFLARVSENLLRNTDIDPIEEAKGYKMLLEKGWTLNAIGEMIGKSDSYVCRRLAMLERLEPDLLIRISTGAYRHVSPSHIELISLVPKKLRQRELVRIVESRRLSVRALENLINGSPLPTKVSVEDLDGVLKVEIPIEFAKAIQMRPGQHLRMYIRGRKIVLELVESKRRRRFSPLYTCQVRHKLKAE